ncbi:MAG: hypothetical protein ORN54_12430 [Cyclobacteriaceae bacterium]|nr:hypothetical protein [Cyclobacteriaceae bacterium]
MTRSSSGTSTLLVVVLLVITFPVWFALLAALFGVAVGLFGAAIGIIAAIFGACITMIALPFKFFFGWGDFHFPFFQTGNGFVIFLLLIVAFVLVQKGRKTRKA